MRLSGWGRYPVIEALVHTPRSEEQLRGLVTGPHPVIARGNGRAYGDSAINPDATISTAQMAQFESFNPQSGQLVAGAGAKLGDIITAFLPQGWFPLVTPGTKFVTLGGMIAADVHGKNHHRDGSMAQSVDWIDLMGPDGEVHRCSRVENPELFAWTIGGMGLTGVILRAAIRLRRVESGWIRQRTLPAPNLRAAMEAFETHAGATYSVAWIDCLAQGSAMGRSLLMLGEHAAPGDLPHGAATPLQVPRKKTRRIGLDLPSFSLNRYSVRAFNALYWRAGQRKTGVQIVDWDSYFYPLDAILGWNRIYGRKGFVQFQCVLPLESAERGLELLLRNISDAGTGSFLAVLKRLGPQHSPFSFPMEGYTLALDFPVSPSVLALMDRLDRIVIDHGGRFYLAKDSRMLAGTLRAADPRVNDFIAMRKTMGLAGRFTSSQSERLSL